MRTFLSPGAWVALVLVVLGGCASNRPPATPLQAGIAQPQDRVLWKSRLGAIKSPLSIATTADAVAVASSNGQITLLDASSGKTKWQVRAPGRLTAGVGSDGRFAAVVNADNELIVAEAGSIRWRATMSSQVLTAPLVAGERVFVLGLDRTVSAFDAKDGRRLWVQRRQGEPLALAQEGVLHPVQDLLLVGVGPRLLALDSIRGNVRQEWAVASPRGTNDVERLADVVAPVARTGDSLCLRAYQAAVTCIRTTDGRVAWSRPAGGYTGLAAASSMVVGADASDRITGWKSGDGAVAWTNQTMLYRGLGAPSATDKAIVFGDRDGWVHFLSPGDGRELYRIATDGSPVASAPRMSGRLLIVATQDGGVYGLRAD